MEYAVLLLLSVFAFFVTRKLFFNPKGKRLHQSFIKLGKFEDKTYADFVAACGRPTTINKGRFDTICIWSDGGYIITIRFDRYDVFKAKVSETVKYK